MRLAHRSIVFCAALLACAIPATASPISYQFRVDGFENNGFITGSFVGEDFDADGILFTSFTSWPPFEIAGFSASYSDDGGFIVGAADLSGLGEFARFDLHTWDLTFSLESVFVFPSFRIGNIDHSNVMYWTEDCCIPVSVRTAQAPQVWQVPDTGSSLVLLTIGVVALLSAWLARAST